MDYRWLENQYGSVSVPLKKDEYLDLISTMLEHGMPGFMRIDYDAWNIVKEEAETYYNGNKPLDSILDVIESRLRIYTSK